MIGLGTIINSAAIVAGGLIGTFTGKLFRQDQQDAVSNHLYWVEKSAHKW